MIATAAASFTPSYPNSEIRLPSRKTAWQHAVAQADLPALTKSVLLILSVEWMDAAGGSCYPTEEQIQAKVGISRPALCRHLRLALERGYLERWHWGHGVQNRRYNYRAAFPSGPDALALPPEIRNDVNLLPLEIRNDVTDHNHDQTFNHVQERAAAPEPIALTAPTPEALSLPPEPKPPTPHTPYTHGTPPTTAPANAPTTWLEEAQHLRPDLPTTQITASIEVFLDYHRALDTRRANWLPLWRNWIRREHASQVPKTGTATPQTTSRYPTPEQRQAPLPAAVQAALVASEQRRIAQLLAAGIDPATGLRQATPDAADQSKLSQLLQKLATRTQRQQGA